MRDLALYPYSANEKRVVEHIRTLVSEGFEMPDDPIGFLIESHEITVCDQAERMRRIRRTIDDKPVSDLVPPRDKEDVVELLFRVQLGTLSCRRASDLLFPQFSRAAMENSSAG